jgi:hypothetical protein
MNRVVGGIRLLTLLACTLAAASAFANTSNVPRRAYVAPRYDLSKEVTLHGTVRSVMPKAQPGMMFGAHLIVSTTHGAVDAPIGPWGLKGPQSNLLHAGDSVTVTGVMTTFNGRSVLLTRLIQVAGQTITVRSKTGAVLLPGAAERRSHSKFFGGAR